MELLHITLAVFFLLASSSAQNESYHVPEVEIYHMHIRSDITFRFATTEVSARLSNRMEEAREVTFSVTLPESAFISNFSMTIDGELYYGKVKPKKVAQREYTAAKKRGESAAKIAKESLESNVFTVTVNVAANGKVNFNLTYQELLLRRLGLYQHVINISPGQIVQDLRLDVYIRESREVTKLRVPSMRDISNEYQIMPADDNALAVIDYLSPTDVHISYVPSVQDQLDTRTDGQFITLYDVEREFDAGEVQLVDGYFVHYFAPSGLDPVAKDISFVIDVSGSMSGDKIEQTKEAMLSVLDDLRPTDRFSIITFSSGAYVWTELGQVLSEASPANVRKAKRFVRGLSAGGGTNINSALVEGIERMVGQYEEETTRPSLIVFLTDGDPTSGVTSRSQIVSNVETANLGRVSLFSLGFGYGLDFNFIKKLSLRNNGFARKIYTGSAATVQLKGFYEEISSPIMSNVKFNYLGDSVDSTTVTNTKFANLFDGAELIVAGKLRENVTSLPFYVSGGAAQGNVSLNMDIQTSEAERRSRELNLAQFTEKLWAYLTIQRLLDRMVATEDQEEKEQLEAQATEMSLNYQFVTPLTSMVVTKPRTPNENVSKQRPSRRRRPTESRPTQNVGSAHRGGFVDNDPHFVIDVDGIGEGLCFDVNTEPGTVLQLLHDKVTGITINSRVVAPPSEQERGIHARTYLGEIWLQHRGHSIHVTPSLITVRHRKYRWADYRITDDRDVVITIVDKKYVDVTYFGNVTFRILRHVIKHPSPSKVDYLGFYVRDGQGLSRWTHGLIGQFQHQQAAIVRSPHLNVTSGRYHSKLRLHGPHSGNRLITVQLGQRRDMDADAHVACWYARNNGAGLLDGLHTQYIVPEIDYGKSAPGIIKLKKARATRRNMLMNMFSRFSTAERPNKKTTTKQAKETMRRVMVQMNGGA